MAAMQLTRTHRILIGVVVAGAVVIAAIGFAGSYAAVRELAEEKGFGDFSLVFPIGIDAGICVLLALDLLLTWMRIPFPLLRQTAWLLTAATIAFNGAASWPDPLGVGMHAVIPVLFVVSVEAARHAVGRIADITADKHMEGVRLTRWLLSPLPTFKLWRRMKLWELRSYEQVIKLEQDRLIYQARLQARFGRGWRRKAPVESLMPLRLAKYGVPLAQTGPAGLAAAGIEPALLPPAPETEAQTQAQLQEVRALPAQLPAQAQQRPESQAGVDRDQRQNEGRGRTQGRDPGQGLPYPDEEWPDEAPDADLDHQDTEDAHAPEQGPGSHSSPWFAAPQVPQVPQAPQAPQAPHAPEQGPGSHSSPWFAAPQVPQVPRLPRPPGPPGPQAAQEAAYDNGYVPAYAEGPEPAPVMVPSGPGRTRPLGGIPGPRHEQDPAEYQEQGSQLPAEYVEQQYEEQQYGEQYEEASEPEEWYYGAFRKYVGENRTVPTAREFGSYLRDLGAEPPTPGELSDYAKRFEIRYQRELDAEHIA
ncbi:hypothetical protein AS594_15340 [Streptomyces agglomeratus]|uniref:DUF2637 domain-containing protein n=1 Tax=Streptomyces agglomeratus TaxID=285458 RepID=A0A1E5P821_9ACTN|nr:DUF2637 domain-containing protein [Streptomyces agglomeratus]OEJ25669.1 hypothetical protein AS594_15340 [Streptomyces agglomeratus]